MTLISPAFIVTVQNTPCYFERDGILHSSNCCFREVVVILMGESVTSIITNECGYPV